MMYVCRRKYSCLLGIFAIYEFLLITNGPKIFQTNWLNDLRWQTLILSPISSITISTAWYYVFKKPMLPKCLLLNTARCSIEAIPWFTCLVIAILSRNSVSRASIIWDTLTRKFFCQAINISPIKFEFTKFSYLSGRYLSNFSLFAILPSTQLN